ncbi:MAG: ribose-5-phosphate isomerase RpiA [Anaerolineae bacterium]
MNVTKFKEQAAEYAVQFVASDMIVGLGHGSTTIFALRGIARRLKEGKLRNVVGVPCSTHVEADARALGIPLTTLNEAPLIDLTIDGADEVDPQLNLIKGGGGALLREKMVAQASRREIIVVDVTKRSDVLGTQWALPIEVVPFGWRALARFLTSLGAEVSLRRTEDETPFHTDQGNYILDADFGPIEDPHALADQLNRRAGIVEHGLFLGLATDVVIAGPEGVQHHKSSV